MLKQIAPDTEPEKLQPDVKEPGELYYGEKEIELIIMDPSTVYILIAIVALAAIAIFFFWLNRLVNTENYHHLPLIISACHCRNIIWRREMAGLWFDGDGRIAGYCG